MALPNIKPIRSKSPTGSKSKNLLQYPKNYIQSQKGYSKSPKVVKPPKAYSKSPQILKAKKDVTKSPNIVTYPKGYFQAPKGYPQPQRINPKTQYINPQVQKINPQVQYINPQAQRINPQAQRINPQAQYINPQFQGAHPQAQLAYPQTQEVYPQEALPPTQALDSQPIEDYSANTTNDANQPFIEMNQYQPNFNGIIDYQLVDDPLAELEISTEAIIHQKPQIFEQLSGCEFPNRYYVFARSPTTGHKILFKCKEQS